MIGLSAGSPFPGESLAALWRSDPGEPPSKISQAFSEIANATAFEPQPGNDLKRHGFQMSLVAREMHYVRDGMGPEQLYDLRLDPYEMGNLIGSAQGDRAVATFRRMLLKELTESPGSIEVENAYLKPYRQWLRTLVQTSSPPRDAISAREPARDGKRD